MLFYVFCFFVWLSLSLLLPGKLKFLIPYLAFPGNPQRNAMEAWLPFAEGRTSRFPHGLFFLWYLARVEWLLLKICCHAQLPLSWSFSWTAGICWCFQLAGFFNSKPGMKEGEKNYPRTLVPSFLASPASLPFSIFLCSLHIWRSQFLVVLRGKNTEKYIFSIFLEAKTWVFIEFCGIFSITK